MRERVSRRKKGKGAEERRQLRRQLIEGVRGESGGAGSGAEESGGGAEGGDECSE